MKSTGAADFINNSMKAEAATRDMNYSCELAAVIWHVSVKIPLLLLHNTVEPVIYFQNNFTYTGVIESLLPSVQRLLISTSSDEASRNSISCFK